MHFLCFVLHLLLFNFQRSAPPFFRRLAYYTTFLTACQYLFSNFFQSFFKDFVALRKVSLIIISSNLKLVNSFSEKFLYFFTFSREKKGIRHVFVLSPNFFLIYIVNVVRQSILCIPYRSGVRNDIADVGHAREVHNDALKAESVACVLGTAVFS